MSNLTLITIINLNWNYNPESKRGHSRQPYPHFVLQSLNSNPQLLVFLVEGPTFFFLMRKNNLIIEKNYIQNDDDSINHTIQWVVVKPKARDHFVSIEGGGVILLCN